MTRRARLALLLVGLLALLGGGYAAWRAVTLSPGAGTGPRGAGARAVDDSARAPAGVRVRVEVLNATRTRGLARRATMHLRDLGFDVVGTGNAGGAPRARTLVLVRSGEQAWGERVARAMGGAGVETRPDSSRYLDVTVLLGGDWQPPPGPFRP